MSPVRFGTMLAILAVALFAAACAPVAVREGSGAEPEGGHFEVAEAPVLARSGTDIVAAYFNSKNVLMFRRGDGSELALSEDDAGDAQRDYAVLHSDGAGLYAFWRPKLTKNIDGVGYVGTKLVYFRASLDGGRTFGPSKRLNRAGGAFQPHVASNGKGDLYVAYIDERNSSDNLDIYLNVSHDRGASWKQDDIKITGNETNMSSDLHLVAEGDRVYASWFTRSYAGDFKIFVRTSRDRGETWDAPVVARDNFAQPATPTLTWAGDKLALCWGDRDAVRCETSPDHGKTWSGPAAIEDSAGTQGLFLKGDVRGNLHMILGRKIGDERSRVNLFYTRSEDGIHFSKQRSLNGGDAFTASAILPTLDIGDDGSVLATWVDLRYLRAVIALNYSKDGGVTWLPEAQVVAGNNRKFNMFPAVAARMDGSYRIVWQEALKRTDASTKIAMADYRPGSFVGVAMPQPDPERLKARVDAFWTLREQGKFDRVYDYMDPFFQEASSRAAYVRSQGAVVYRSHKLVGEPELHGVRGSMNVSYESEVPELMLHGKKISVPDKVVEVPQEWVWVDGEWYCVFRDLFGGSNLPD